MSTELLNQLETQAEEMAQAVRLLKLQIEELEEENALLKAEQEKWRHDLSHVIDSLETKDTANA